MGEKRKKGEERKSRKTGKERGKPVRRLMPLLGDRQGSLSQGGNFRMVEK